MHLSRPGFDTVLDFLLSKAEEPSLPNYLSIAEEKTDWLMPFSTVLSQHEMQTTSSRTWTQVADFISFDGKYYANYFHINQNKKIKDLINLPEDLTC